MIGTCSIQHGPLALEPIDMKPTGNAGVALARFFPLEEQASTAPSCLFGVRGRLVTADSVLLEFTFVDRESSRVLAGVSACAKGTSGTLTTVESFTVAVDDADEVCCCPIIPVVECDGCGADKVGVGGEELKGVAVDCLDGPDATAASGLGLSWSGVVVFTGVYL